MATNRQVGLPIVTRRPPKFTGYVVVGGTWKPADQLKDVEHENEDEVIFNVGFYAPGTKVSCQLYQKLTSPVTPDLAKGQVITEEATDENPSPGSWLVKKADPMDFGSRGLVFDTELMRSGSLDLSQTTPA